jgi:hypothetical protein
VSNPLSSNRKNSFRRRVIELTVNLHLEHFDHYVSKMSADLAGEKQEIEKRLKELSAGVTQDEAEFLEYEFSDEFYLIDDIFLPLFIHSSTFSLFAFFESELVALCKRLDQSAGNSAWPATRGSGIEKAKAYLTAHAGVQFGQLNTHWQSLSNMLKVRNCLAHADGNISQMSSTAKQAEIKQIVRTTSGLNISPQGRLEVDRKYLQDRSADIRGFLLALANQIYP